MIPNTKNLISQQTTIELSEIINANTNYIIPLNYRVGNNSLKIYYCDSKLKKGVDYIEVGEANSISNTIQFLDSVGDLDMSQVDGFENFKETLEFVVRR